MRTRSRRKEELRKDTWLRILKDQIPGTYSEEILSQGVLSGTESLKFERLPQMIQM